MTIVIPATAETIAGFAAIALHIGKDAGSPIIGNVRVSHRFAVATDRYTVARLEHTTIAESIERHGEEGPIEPDAFAILPGEIAQWIGKLKVTAYERAEITVTPTSVSVTRNGEPTESRTFAEVHGNYPPVDRLFPEVSDASIDVSPLRISAEYLLRLAKSAQLMARAVKDKGQVMRLQMSEPHAQHGSPRPVLATCGRLSMLAQPIKSLR